MSENFKIIGKYFKNFKPNKKYLFLMFISSMIAVLASTISPIFNGKLIDALIEGDLNNSFMYLAIFIGLLIAYNIFYIFNYYFYTKFYRYGYNKTQKEIVKKTFDFDKFTLNDNFKSKLINIISDSVEQVSELGDELVEASIEFLALLVSVIILFRINISIALIVIVFNLIIVILIEKSNVKAEELDGRRRREKDKLINVYSGILNSIEEIKNLNVESRLGRKYSRVSSHFSKRKVDGDINDVIREHIIPIVVLIMRLGLMVYLVILIQRGQLEVEDFVVITSYFVAISTKIGTIMKYGKRVRVTNVAMNRVIEVLNYKLNSTYEFGNIENENVKGLIRFNDVSLSFGDNKILRNLNFEIPNNKTTVIVGKSACGKTSILNLILRKTKPTAGTITVDNVDIFDYTRETHNANVGIVMQNPILFNMSLKNNLMVSDNSSNYSKVIKDLNIDAIADKLPLGYNTIINNSYTLLTLEDKQRIAFARILIDDAKIVLLDELTNRLDKEVVREFYSLTNELEGDHTIISVTNNKDEIINSDYVVMLEGGEVITTGTPEELLKTSDSYRELIGV